MSQPKFEDLPSQVQQQLRLEAAVVGQRVQALYPLSTEKEISAAVNKAVSESLALNVVVQWMHGQGEHTDKVLVVDVGRMSALGDGVNYLFSIIERTPKNEVPLNDGDPDIEAFMHGLTAEGLVFSTSTRAIAYMKGWSFRFRLLPESEIAQSSGAEA